MPHLNVEHLSLNEERYPEWCRNTPQFQVANMDRLHHQNQSYSVGREDCTYEAFEMIRKNTENVATILASFSNLRSAEPPAAPPPAPPPAPLLSPPQSIRAPTRPQEERAAAQVEMPDGHYSRCYSTTAPSQLSTLSKRPTSVENENVREGKTGGDFSDDEDAAAWCVSSTTNLVEKTTK